MRKKIVAGNWKMNTSITEGVTLVKNINAGLSSVPTDVTLIVAPPYTHLTSIAPVLGGVKLSSQDCSSQDKGAYTGEVSVTMLKEVGCSFVIIGHSERRSYHKETSPLLRVKIEKALEKGLSPIFCIGETLDIRENGTYLSDIENQLTEVLKGLSVTQMQNIVLAYEPVWAIGTGKTASEEQAQEVHASIRKVIATLFDNSTAEGVSILYGGSCNAANAKAIFAKPDVDGGLIGGAALDSDAFLTIAKSF